MCEKNVNFFFKSATSNLLYELEYVSGENSQLLFPWPYLGKKVFKKFLSKSGTKVFPFRSPQLTLQTWISSLHVTPAATPYILHTSLLSSISWLRLSLRHLFNFLLPDFVAAGPPHVKILYQYTSCWFFSILPNYKAKHPFLWAGYKGGCLHIEIKRESFWPLAAHYAGKKLKDEIPIEGIRTREMRT